MEPVFHSVSVQAHRNKATDHGSASAPGNFTGHWARTIYCENFCCSAASTGGDTNLLTSPPSIAISRTIDEEI